MSDSVKFEVGDVVELKSGGPEMTICNMKAGPYSNKIQCQWFGGKKLEHGLFDPLTLVPATKDKK